MCMIHSNDAMCGGGCSAADDANRVAFKAGYQQMASTRILRGRLYVNREDGTATVTFRGQIGDATTDLWVERGSSGRLSLMAEVEVTEDSATEIRVAVVPTGKRVAAVDDAKSHRIGSVDGRHVYLLSVDGSADRAAYDAEVARIRDERTARQQERLLAAAVEVDEYDGLGVRDAEDYAAGGGL